MDCIVTIEIANHLAEIDRRAARLDAIEARAEALLEDPQFIWEFMGDLDQGDGLQGQAVKGIVKAVMAEMTKNPALTHRYRRLALKEAQCQLEEEITCSRAFDLRTDLLAERPGRRSIRRAADRLPRVAKRWAGSGGNRDPPG